MTREFLFFKYYAEFEAGGQVPDQNVLYEIK